MDRQAVQERFGIIGTSATLGHAVDRIRLVAGTDVTVLLEGESGVGKELFANAIHGLSQRRHKSIQAINMGAIPEGLIEAELFGAEKGSYSSSVAKRVGYFEKAHGGTLFMDEIGEMPPAMQVRLLRVLESGSFNRVGSSTAQLTDARVIAATNKDLGREVQAGRFREDLYYRLSTVIIRVPPLRERPEDIYPLFRRFLDEFAARYQCPLHRLADDAVRLLKRYHWPGNVRELRNVAEASTITYTEKEITVEMLRPLLRGVALHDNTALVPVTRQDDTDPSAFSERTLMYRALVSQQVVLQQLHEEVRKLRSGLERIAALQQNNGTVVPATAPAVPLLPERAVTPGDNFIGYVEAQDADVDPDNAETIPTLVEAERDLITRALAHFGGNKRKAAQALGISERSLYRKIKEARTASA